MLSYGAPMSKILWEREKCNMRNNLSLEVKILVNSAVSKKIEVWKFIGLTDGWIERKKERN